MHKMTQPKLYSRNSKLWVRFTLNGENIRRSLNIDDTKANKKLANTQLIPQMILRIHTGEFFENEVVEKIPTVDEYSEVSFASHKHERKETTTKDYRNIYNKHVKPYFGKKRLDEIKVSDINTWKNKLFGEIGLSSRRVNAIKKVLGTIIEDAVLDEVINSNPVRKSRPLPPHQQKDIFPFSLDEISKILNHTKEQNQNLIATLFMTGMRTGELIGLKWSDIDFDRKTINIQRTIGRGIISTPKTISSIREIPILNPLLPYIESQFDITGNENSYVFLNQNNSHFFDSKNIRDGLWKQSLKNANVEYRTVYQTRHTFCSINLQNGEDLIWISKVLGHKNPKITLEKYSKYIPTNSSKGTIFNQLSA